MALKDSVLNIVIKAKDLAGDTISKFVRELRGIEDAGKSADKTLDEVGSSARDAGKNVASAGSDFDKLDSAIDKVEASSKSVNAALDGTEKELDGVQSSGAASAAAINQASTAAGKLAQRFDAAGKPIATTKQELKGANQQLKETDGASTKTGASIATFAKRLLALAAAAVGIRTITTALKSILTTGDQFEKLGMQMEQAMGSIEGGKQATAWVTQFAKDTPLQMQEVTETFTRLKNFGIDPMNGAMQAIVDQASALGGGYERVTGISLALGQAWAKQKLQGEEILQLIERGVPVWDLLEKATGKNTAELQKLSSAGALGRDVMKQLMDEMGKASAGAAAKNMTLLSGYVSNLKDEWQLFLNEIAKAGALDYAKEQLAGLLQTIQQMKANGDLQDLAKRISDGLITIAEATKSTVLALKENAGAIVLLGKAYLGLKLAGVAADVGKLGLAMKAQLAAGTIAAVTQTKALALAMRAIPWLAVIQGVVTVADAYAQLKDAQRELADSQATQNKVQDEASQRIAEFNQQTGLAAQSLDDLIRAQDAGIATIDEYTGKWRLATDVLTEAEIAQRAQSEAAKQSASDLSALNAQVRNMVDTFKATQGEGKTLAETIKAMGDAAKAGGQQGIEALSISLERLALEGAATREELATGLGDYLASLSEEEYTRFGAEITAEFERIQNSVDATSNRLTFMQTLLDANLTAAAQRAGVAIGAVLTGIDEESSLAINAFSNLVNQLDVTGTAANDADKIIKAGLLETLKGLDTTQEIGATIAAIQALGESGVLSAKQVAELTAVVKQKGQELQDQNDQNTSKQVENNAQIRDSVAQVTTAQQTQTEEVGRSAGAATALANAYRAIRATVDELGPAASAAFEKLQGIDTGVGDLTGEFADLRKMIQDANADIDQMRSLTVADFTGISRFIEQTGHNAAMVRKEYAEQKLALEQLKQQYQEGSISAAQFANSARGAVSATSLLGQQDLSYLRNAIRAAEEQMERFRDSTMGTLNSLQAELAQLQGNAAKVAELNYEARVTDLEQRLADAKDSGDTTAIANAQKALQVAKEIHATRMMQIQEEQKAMEKQRAEAERDKQAEKDRQDERDQKPIEPIRPTPQQQPLPNQLGQRIELALPNGSTASVTGEPEDVNRLLDFLRDAGLRAT